MMKRENNLEQKYWDLTNSVKRLWARKNVYVYTDMPLSNPNENQVKLVRLLNYDMDKYCEIEYCGELYWVKSGYLYLDKKKLDEEPRLANPIKLLASRNFWQKYKKARRKMWKEKYDSFKYEVVDCHGTVFSSSKFCDLAKFLKANKNKILKPYTVYASKPGYFDLFDVGENYITTYNDEQNIYII